MSLIVVCTRMLQQMHALEHKLSLYYWHYITGKQSHSTGCANYTRIPVCTKVMHFQSCTSANYQIAPDKIRFHPWVVLPRESRDDASPHFRFIADVSLFRLLRYICSWSTIFFQYYGKFTIGIPIVEWRDSTLHRSFCRRKFSSRLFLSEQARSKIS